MFSIQLTFANKPDVHKNSGYVSLFSPRTKIAHRVSKRIQKIENKYPEGG